MQRSTLLHFARRHVRWLLCFALLLPVAQWASVAHPFTHTADASGRSGQEPGAHLQHCPICPVAAAVAASGLACSPLAFAAVPHGLGKVAITHAPVPALDAPRPPANRGPPSSFA